MKALTEFVRENYRSLGLRTEPRRVSLESIWCGYGQMHSITTLIFIDNDRFPALVAKLGESQREMNCYETEYRNLLLLQQSESRPFRDLVPKPLICDWVKGHPLLIESALPGVRLKKFNPASLYSERRAERLLKLLIDWLIYFHRSTRIERVPLSEELIDTLVAEPIKAFCAHYIVSPREEEYFEMVLASFRELLGKPVPLVYTHGDFWAGNILVCPHGLGVIDWEDPLVLNFPLFDVFLLLVSCEFKVPDLKMENDFELFRAVYFQENYFSQAARRCIDHYVRQLGLDRAFVRPLFALAWVYFANKKYEYLRYCLGVDTPELWSEAEKLVPIYNNIVVEDGACVLTRYMTEGATPVF